MDPRSFVDYDAVLIDPQAILVDAHRVRNGGNVEVLVSAIYRRQMELYEFLVHKFGLVICYLRPAKTLGLPATRAKEGFGNYSILDDIRLAGNFLLPTNQIMNGTGRRYAGVDLDEPAAVYFRVLQQHLEIEAHFIDRELRGSVLAVNPVGNPVAARFNVVAGGAIYFVPIPSVPRCSMVVLACLWLKWSGATTADLRRCGARLGE